eukprot:scaffold160274_cov28-Tisochrysis_lutea.AAC.1
MSRMVAGARRRRRWRWREREKKRPVGSPPAISLARKGGSKEEEGVSRERRTVGALLWTLHSLL